MKSVACFSAAAAFAVYHVINYFFLHNAFAPSLLPAYILLIIGLISRKREKESAAQQAATEKMVSDAAATISDAVVDRLQKESDYKARRTQEEADRKARQAQWEKTHGKYECKVAGVTFENSDGVSRQTILKNIYRNEYDPEYEECLTSGSIELVDYQYKGELAYHVFYDGDCIGNIPRSCVSDIAAISSRVTAGSLTISKFDRDEALDDDEEDPSVTSSDSTVYYAVLEIIYTKEEAEA